MRQVLHPPNCRFWQMETLSDLIGGSDGTRHCTEHLSGAPIASRQVGKSNSQRNVGHALPGVRSCRERSAGGAQADLARMAREGLVRVLGQPLEVAYRDTEARDHGLAVEIGLGEPTRDGLARRPEPDRRQRSVAGIVVSSSGLSWRAVCLPCRSGRRTRATSEARSAKAGRERRHLSLRLKLCGFPRNAQPTAARMT